MSSPGQFIRTIDSELFAVGDGVTRMWPLMVAGKPVRNVHGAPTIYQEDWQGRVELSSEARTECLPNNDTLDAWHSYNTGTATHSLQKIADPQLGTVWRLTKTAGAVGDRAGISTKMIGMTGDTYVVSAYVRASSATTTFAAPYVDAVKVNSVNLTSGVIREGAQYAGSFTRPTAARTAGIELRGDGTAYLWVESAVGDYIDIKFPSVRLGAIAGHAVPTINAPVNVTDYTYTAPTATIITPEPLPKGTKLYWSGELVFDSDPSLLPTSAVHGTKVVESAISSMANLPVPLRDLWNPYTCPLELLPWLAWALSIDAWKSYWPESIKRERVARALDIQRHKGTAQSVQNVIASFGGAVQLREWWQQSPPGDPHTFDMILTLASATGTAATAQYVDDVIAEVTRTKPVRSHFTFTQGITAAAKIGVASVARPVAYRRMNFQAA